MIDLTQIQREHTAWEARNFPGESLAHVTLGVCEEAGELAHSILKMEQGIRGSAAKHRADAMDAIGDINIYLMGVAERLGTTVEECIADSWTEVKQRDWIKNNQTGGA